MGYCKSSNGVQHACEWVSGGGFYDFNVFGGTNSTAEGINDYGWVVGNFLDSGGTFHSFLFDQSDEYVYPDLFSTFPKAINNSFEVTGYTLGAYGGFISWLSPTSVTNPIIISFRRQGNAGVFSLGNLIMGETIVLQASSDLHSWSPVATNIVFNSGGLTITNSTGVQGSKSFFRVLAR